MVFTRSVKIDTSSHTSADVRVFIRVDHIALERPENFTLTLAEDSEDARELLIANFMEDSVFVFSTIEVIIEDTESMYIP